MFLISDAYAQDAEITQIPATTATTSADGSVAPLPTPVSPWEVMGTNLLMVVVLVVMFYVLLIMPQQRRMKEHGTMLRGLKKGDSIITAGGLVGVIEKADDGADEVVIDLGNSVKVTALRATIQAKNDPRLKPLPAANSNKSEPTKTSGKPAPKSKK